MPVTAGIEMGTMRMGMYSIEGIQDVFRIRVVVISQIQRIQEFLLEKFHPNKNSKKPDENSSLIYDSTNDSTNNDSTNDLISETSDSKKIQFNR